MKTEIVGRIREQKALMEYMDSKESEFIAIYGCRRVGKTFEFDNLYRALFKYSEKYCGGVAVYSHILLSRVFSDKMTETFPFMPCCIKGTSCNDNVKQK